MFSCYLIVGECLQVHQTPHVPFAELVHLSGSLFYSLIITVRLLPAAGMASQMDHHQSKVRLPKRSFRLGGMTSYCGTQGLCMDAQAALDYILAHPRLGESRVVSCFCHIFCLCATTCDADLAWSIPRWRRCHLLDKSEPHQGTLPPGVFRHTPMTPPPQIHALMVENTFTSLPEVIPHLFPKLTYLRFLCHEKWESAKRLPMIPQTIPILMLSGRVDEVVPPRHMNELWAIVMGREGSCDQDEAVTRTDAVHRKGSHNEDSVAVWTGADANEQDCRVTYRGNSRFVEIPTGSHSTSVPVPWLSQLSNLSPRFHLSEQGVLGGCQAVHQ